MSGRPSKEDVVNIKENNDWMFSLYGNHGNSAAHALGKIHDQTNKKRDILNEEEFGKEGRSINRFITRGMFFCNTILRQNDLLFRAYNRPSTSYKWGWYLTPIIYLYDIKEILTLVKYGNAEYYEKKIPTYEHDFEDSVHEIRLVNRKFCPKPKLIVVGKTKAALREEERLPIKLFHEMVGCNVLHLPHINLGAYKDKLATGNKTVSINAIRIIDCVKSIQEKL